MGVFDDIVGGVTATIDVIGDIITSPIGQVVRDVLLPPGPVIMGGAGTPTPVPTIGPWQGPTMPLPAPPMLGARPDFGVGGQIVLGGRTFEMGGGISVDDVTGGLPMAGPPGAVGPYTGGTIGMTPIGGAGKAPGGIFVNSLFHYTPCGFVRPNRVSAMQGPDGSWGFFANAGAPKTFSKVTLKTTRRCGCGRKR